MLICHEKYQNLKEKNRGDGYDCSIPFKMHVAIGINVIYCLNYSYHGLYTGTWYISSQRLLCISVLHVHCMDSCLSISKMSVMWFRSIIVLLLLVRILMYFTDIQRYLINILWLLCSSADDTNQRQQLMHLTLFTTQGKFKISQCYSWILCGDCC